MDIANTILNSILQIWYIIPFFIFVSILKSHWFKGVFGEFLVNKLLDSLPKKEYTLIKNFTLPTDDGTTQVDHVLVSKFGIFVIETKNMKGWIFGSPHQKQWTQKIYRHSAKFQNPLHQNYKHIKTLESVLDCNPEFMHSLIVFVGDSTFKTEMPDNVTAARGCLDYIKQFNEAVIPDTEVYRLVTKLNQIKLKPGLVTDYKHRQHVKELVVSKNEVTKEVGKKVSQEVSQEASNMSSDPLCPRCGSAMVIRETKRGANAGQQFWGCSTFPKCRGLQLKEC
ncbi:nuclease [Nitrincola tibetensis]|uniref:Nuclease n=1 Tax=Nitrincola tibetensis TaxID=2219697 RepID=A0A364NJ31_9GAMM|nr:NERD domain-containing protein [Nitrincola tibetensis]RAU17063.1 nuclease [Nitrincola tibetensis]